MDSQEGVNDTSDANAFHRPMGELFSCAAHAVDQHVLQAMRASLTLPPAYIFQSHQLPKATADREAATEVQITTVLASQPQEALLTACRHLDNANATNIRSLCNQAA